MLQWESPVLSEVLVQTKYSTQEGLDPFNFTSPDASVQYEYVTRATSLFDLGMGVVVSAPCTFHHQKWSAALV